MRASAYEMYIQSYHESSENLAVIETEYPNVEIKTFPTEVIDAMRKVNDRLLVEYSEKDPLAKKILDSQADYLNKVRKWTDISDKAYLNSIAQ